MNPIVSILIVIAVLGFMFYLWYAVTTRQGIGKWLVQRHGNHEIQIVDQVGIAPRASILLVDVRNESFLVAQGPQGVQIVSLKAPPSKTEVSKS